MSQAWDQCRAARAILRWTLDDLVVKSSVGRATIARFETGAHIKPATAILLRVAFEAERVGFIDAGDYAGGVFFPRRVS